MTQDLFDKRDDKQKLLDWMWGKKEARTSDVIKFGSSIGSNRADRNARQLAEEGKLKRLDDKEKLFRYGNTVEDVWVFVG